MMRAFRNSGYSLVELLIVVSLLSLIAAIAVPSSQSNNEESIEFAANEFAAAMRFARSESIRTGEPHGFRAESGAKRIRVFRLDMAASPPTLIYDVYHPVSKQLYDVQLDVSPFAAADVITRTAVYRGTCNIQGNVYFDVSGTPWCADPETILLESFDVDMTLGVSLRTVSLGMVTGRVTVQ